MGIEIFNKHLREKRAIKIDAGINNNDLKSIEKIARSVQSGRASALDITADKRVYDCARKNTKMPIFVSSIHPLELLQAVKWGADAIEIGNYQDLYKNGTALSAEQVYDITLEAMSLTERYDTFVSVTIPAVSSLDEQIDLIKKFEIIGVDLIQVEGIQKQTFASVSNLVLSSRAAAQNTLKLSQYTSIPLMTSTLINPENVQDAFGSGASGVSVGYAVNTLNSEAQMTTTIMQLVNSISYRNSINKDLIRTRHELEASYQL